MPSIDILEGELRDGSALELIVDFRDDALSFLHRKKFVAFSERYVKYDQFKQQYYYEEGKGVVYESIDADNLYIDKLIVGRLFVMFNYTNIYNETFVISKVFRVLPTINVNIEPDIKTNNVSLFKIESNVENLSAKWDFDNDVVVYGNNVYNNFSVDGYSNVSINLDYSNLLYKDKSIVIWDSYPENKLTTGVNGYFGGGVINPTIVEESVTQSFLVKYNLDDSLDLNIDISSNGDNEYTAPLRSLITDNSIYNLTGDNAIEYTIIDFGDGDIRKSVDINFKFYKLFKRSGKYDITYTVYTKHKLFDGSFYRQNKIFNTSITINPFFGRFFKQQFVGSLYNSDGFNDLASAWGTQMDRLYNDTQRLLESIDIENIDDKFLSSLASTYGDFYEIYSKIGFSSFTRERDDVFGYLKDYNFFNRIHQGDLLDEEKQEFIFYIKHCINNLRIKGTSESIEKAISNFGLIAKVHELWVTTFKPRTNEPILDEVFNNDLQTNTGISYKQISSPSSDNNNCIIVNNKFNSYIEINSATTSKTVYVTEDTEVTFINGVPYLAIEKT
jgi:hypothetical protein